MQVRESAPVAASGLVAVACNLSHLILAVSLLNCDSIGVQVVRRVFSHKSLNQDRRVLDMRQQRGWTKVHSR